MASKVHPFGRFSASREFPLNGETTNSPRAVRAVEIAPGSLAVVRVTGRLP